MLKNKPDYNLKEFILSNYPDLLKLESQLRRCILLNENYVSGNIVLTPDQCVLYYDHMKRKEILFDECYKINHAWSQRYKRLRDRIESFLNSHDHVQFITFTFTDDVLNHTDPKTRRQYISRFLKKTSLQYVANIDFGDKTGREHYHAVAVSCPIVELLYPYGFIKSENIPHEDIDLTRVSKYVSKLTNHAIKESTKRNSLIYSR